MTNPRDDAGPGSGDRSRRRGEPTQPPPPPDEWVRTDRRGSSAAPRRTTAPTGRGLPRAGAELPADVASEIRRAADTATARHRESLVGRMAGAVAAYDRGRYGDALRLGSQVAKEVTSVAAVRRLAGLAAYRLGRWRDALRHLEAYEAIAGESDTAPLVMDAERALGRHKKVAQRWSELRRTSPDPGVLAEARIVAAGSLADQGQFREAIELLEAGGAARSLRNPSERHLRQWYALGDLYERAGDVPRARELFLRVARVDPEAYDVPDRLDALGPVRRTGSRRRPARKAAR